ASSGLASQCKRLDSTIADSTAVGAATKRTAASFNFPTSTSYPGSFSKIETRADESTIIPGTHQDRCRESLPVPACLFSCPARSQEHSAILHAPGSPLFCCPGLWLEKFAKPNGFCDLPMHDEWLRS